MSESAIADARPAIPPPITVIFSWIPGPLEDILACEILEY